MIRKITFLVIVLFSVLSYGQFGPVGHLNIFSEDGDKFFVIINGEQINDTPQTNIRIEDLNQPYYNVKIKFADKSIQDILKNTLMIADADGKFADVTYKIRSDKKIKTKRKLNYFSSTPVVPDFIPPSNVYVVHFGQPVPAITQTTTTTTTQQNSGGVNVGVSVGGVNMGVSVNDGMNGNTVTQTTTTTTSSSSTMVQNSDNAMQYNDSRRRCPGRYSMTSGNFNAALATLKKQNFEDSRLKTAKQIVSANCMNVNQIMQIAKLFNFEDNKLEFAKYAYDYCVEPRNYFQLNGIFNFSSNADELSDYVQSRP